MCVTVHRVYANIDYSYTFTPQGSLYNRWLNINYIDHDWVS